MYTSKKILVTGGLGFIGSYLTKQLLENGHSITIFDRQNPKENSLFDFGLCDHQNLKIHKVDLLHAGELENFDKNFDIIVHAAAILGVGHVSQFPLSTMNVNYSGTFNMVDFARKQKKLERFIFFSTSEIYGPENSYSVEEDDAVIPTLGMRWNYSSSKLLGEYLVKGAGKEFNLPYSIIRPFNVYGPFRQGSNAMTSLVRSALLGEPLILTGLGEQKRSWCYIDDFIYALERCIFEKQAVGQVFNIGNDENNISIYDLAEKIVKLTNSTSRIIRTGSIIDDVMERKPNITKARTLLNYNPKTDLECGIEKVVQWLSKIEKPSYLKAG